MRLRELTKLTIAASKPDHRCGLATSRSFFTIFQSLSVVSCYLIRGHYEAESSKHSTSIFSCSLNTLFNDVKTKRFQQKLERA